MGDARSDAVVVAAHAALVTGRGRARRPAARHRSRRRVIEPSRRSCARWSTPSTPRRPTPAGSREGAVADGAPGTGPDDAGDAGRGASRDGRLRVGCRAHPRPPRVVGVALARRPPARRAARVPALGRRVRALAMRSATPAPPIGVGRWPGGSSSAASWAHLRMGHLDDAVATGESARACVDPAVGDLLLELTVPALVIAHLERHAVPEAEEVAAWAATVPVFTAGTGLRLATARVHAAHDELDRAVEVLREAVDIEAARGRHNIVGVLYAELVELAVAADDAVAARAANDRLQALPRSRSAIAMNMRCLLSDAMCRRTSDLAVGGRPLRLPPRARARRRSGPRPRRRDPPRRRHLCRPPTRRSPASARYRQRHVAAQLRAIGRRAADATATTGRRSAPRRRRCPTLVAEGLTNRQVGAHMGLSPKTIEVYLSRIYAKTGLPLAGRAGRGGPRRDAADPGMTLPVVRSCHASRHAPVRSGYGPADTDGREPRGRGLRWAGQGAGGRGRPAPARSCRASGAAARQRGARQRQVDVPRSRRRRRSPSGVPHRRDQRRPGRRRCPPRRHPPRPRSPLVRRDRSVAAGGDGGARRRARPPPTDVARSTPPADAADARRVGLPVAGPRRHRRPPPRRSALGGDDRAPDANDPSGPRVHRGHEPAATGRADRQRCQPRGARPHRHLCDPSSSASSTPTSWRS